MSETNKKIKPLRLPTCYYCDLPFDHDFDSLVTEETIRLFVNYNPCQKCKESIKKGFLVMGVVYEPTFPEQPPIHEENNKKLYPTQNIVVLTKKAKELLKSNDPNLSHITDETPGVYMPDDIVKELINTLDVTSKKEKNNDPNH